MKSTLYTVFLPLVVTVSTLLTAASGLEYIMYEAPFENWTISEKGKASLKKNCGFDGKRSCFVLEGTKDTNPMVTGPKIPATMKGDVLHIRALFKCTDEARPYLGFDNAYYAIANTIYVNKTTVGNDWIETSAILRLPDVTSRQLFFGLYHLDGTCYFDKIELTQAEVVPVTEDPKYGLLGPEDTIYKNGTFESIIFDNDFYSSINPYVKSITPRWNSNRACFSDNQNITFDYSGVTALLAKPLTVELHVYYVTGADAFLTLMQSNDGGKTWSDVGTFGKKVEVFKFTLSSVNHNMFCVIMKNSPGSVQLSKVRVISTVKNKPSATVRSKQIVHVPVEENGIALTISEKADAKRKLNIKLTNTGNATIENFEFDSSSIPEGGPELSVDKDSGSINQGESMVIVGRVTFTSSDDTVINYGIHNSDGTVMYASGFFITTPPFFFDDDSYGNYIAEDSACGTLWWCGSTYKVSKERLAPEQASKKSAIDIYAAKNEYEAFQLVLKASSSDQIISDVSITPLASVENSSVVISNVSVRRVMYLKTDHPSDRTFGRAGEHWPDPLIPLDLPYKCSAGENCLFWVLIYVPFDAQEGSYKGTVSLTASGKKLSSDVILKVWNFTIPKKQRFKSLLGFNSVSVDAYHHTKDANYSVRGAIYDKYFASFSRHRISPMRGYPLHWYKTEYVDGKLKFNYDKFINRVKETHSADGFGFSSDVLVLNGMYSPIGEYEWGTKQHRKLFKEGNAYAQKILKDNNLLSEFYVYWIDEPSEADYDRIIEGNTAIKEGSPEIQILLTEPVVDKLKGYVDAWCPPFVNYVKEDIVERQKLGEEAWTYLCCCPKEKRITLLIDHPASELRLWNWHSFKNNIAGILIWQVMYWTRNYTDMQDPYTDVTSWDTREYRPWGNGDGRFFFPPLNWNKNFDEYIFDDPIESIRLEILRDGLEDWEYFTTLKEISTSKGATKEQKRIAKKLLDIPDSIIGDTDIKYSRTPEEMLKRRNEVGKFINAYFCGEEYSYSFSTSEDYASSLANPFSFLTMIIMIAIAFISQRF